MWLLKLKLNKSKNSVPLVPEPCFECATAHTAASYHFGQCSYKTFPTLQQVSLDTADLKLSLCKVYSMTDHWVLILSFQSILRR